ncbi:HAD family hydrolase [Actinocorallia aurea]
MNAVRAACFDLYSTLIHESPDNTFYQSVADDLDYDFRHWYRAYKNRGIESMSGALEGMTERVLIAGNDVGQSRSFQMVSEVVDRRFPQFVANISIDPEALPALRLLRSLDIPIALVSNASSYSETVLDELRLRPFFDSITLSYRIGRMKPHPDIYLRAVADISIPPESFAFVGDGGDDELAGARAIGMRTILLDRDLPHRHAAEADADAVVAGLQAAAASIVGPAAVLRRKRDVHDQRAR